MLRDAKVWPRAAVNCNQSLCCLSLSGTGQVSGARVKGQSFEWKGVAGEDGEVTSWVTQDITNTTTHRKFKQFAIISPHVSEFMPCTCWVFAGYPFALEPSRLPVPRRCATKRGTMHCLIFIFSEQLLCIRNPCMYKPRYILKNKYAGPGP